MFHDVLDANVTYVHTIAKKHIRAAAPLMTYMRVQDWDIGATCARRRFVDPRVGAKYFGESRETVRAEKLHQMRQNRFDVYMDDLADTHLALGVTFRSDVRVLSMYLAEGVPAAFEKAYGVSVADCFLPDDYLPSQRVATQVSGSLSGVKYRSVRRPDGHCIAAFYPQRDVASCIVVGDL